MLISVLPWVLGFKTLVAELGRLVEKKEAGPKPLSWNDTINIRCARIMCHSKGLQKLIQYSVCHWDVHVLVGQRNK